MKGVCYMKYLWFYNKEAWTRLELTLFKAFQGTKLFEIYVQILISDILMLILNLVFISFTF